MWNHVWLPECLQQACGVLVSHCSTPRMDFSGSMAAFESEQKQG